MTDSRLLNAQVRQERVKLLLTRNLTAREIAEAVGASLRTINYDVKQIRHEMAASLTRSNVLDIAAIILARSEARHRELWSLYVRVDAAAPSKCSPAAAIALKLSLLRELSRQSMQEVEMLLKLGILIPADKEMMRGMKAVTLLNSLPPEELKRALSQDAKQFSETLRSNLGDAAMAELFGDGWKPNAGCEATLRHDRSRIAPKQANHPLVVRAGRRCGAHGMKLSRRLVST